MKTLLALEAAQTPFDTHHVLAVNVPVMHYGKTPSQIVDYYREATRRILELPGVQNVAVGADVPWRTNANFALQVAVDGHVPAPGEERPGHLFRWFHRDFSPRWACLSSKDAISTKPTETAASQWLCQPERSAADIPNGALNHHLTWNDPLLNSFQ